ncbi:hypothetical protein C8R43DRAFT_1010422 [Mycena crocata]|nr:hypothetical protein C8R43DRAFT_1010422 [Mycena crocata]
MNFQRDKDTLSASSSKAEPIVIDDSDTEDESDAQVSPAKRSLVAGASTTVSTQKTRATKAIVDDDSVTEDESDGAEGLIPRPNSAPRTSILIRKGSEIPPPKKALPGAGSSTAVSTKEKKAHATKAIVVEDSMTEEESDGADELIPKTKSYSAPRITASVSKGADKISIATGSSVSSGKEQTSTSSTQTGSLGSLPDRAQMEADRLARRKRMLDDADATGDSKRQRVSGTIISSTPKTPLASRTFFDGAFFPTATLDGSPRADGRKAIEFHEIIGPTSGSDLQFAILSSFGCSPEWLTPHFNSSVPVILVVGTGTEQSGPSMSSPMQNWVQTCPKLGTGGCMHMKYMLLFYKSGRLRVVVSTANLIPLDWKHLENSVFIQDVFPPSSSNVIGNTLTVEKMKESTSGAQNEDPESFAILLESVLRATNVAPALEHIKKTNSTLPLKSISDLSKKWDWSNVSAELVPSIAGKWEGWKKVNATGHPRLMCAIKTLGLATSKTQSLVVECSGSSIGMYTTQWFNQFYLSASGQSSALKSHLDIPEAKRKKLEYPAGVKVVFPTLETVKSTAGHGANSLFCVRKKWEGKGFPRAAFHDSKSRAGRVLMHTKMIIGSITQKQGTTQNSPSDPAGWMYVGSHNFTAPAWGNLSGSDSAPVLNVNNFELGVVVPLKTAEDLNQASAWERPPKKYSTRDLPWLKDENSH